MPFDETIQNKVLGVGLHYPEPRPQASQPRPKNSQDQPKTKSETTIPWNIRLNTQLGTDFFPMSFVWCLYGPTLPSSGEFGSPRSGVYYVTSEVCTRQTDRQTSGPKTQQTILAHFLWCSNGGYFNKPCNFGDALSTCLLSRKFQ